MYVSEDMVPQNVFSMALRVIGSRNGYMFCKAGSWTTSSLTTGAGLSPAADAWGLRRLTFFGAVRAIRSSEHKNLLRINA